MDAKVQEAAQPLDLVWGAKAIGEVIGKNERVTFGLLESGLLPAKQIGRRWVASRGKLVQAFTDSAKAG
jgi:hypothetical protein